MGGVQSIQIPAEKFRPPKRFIDFQNERCSNAVCDGDNRCTIDYARDDQYEAKRAKQFDTGMRTHPRVTVKDNIKYRALIQQWKQKNIQQPIQTNYVRPYRGNDPQCNACSKYSTRVEDSTDPEKINISWYFCLLYTSDAADE